MDWHIYIFLTAFCFHTLLSWSQEHSPKQDPLNKPRIWSQLVKTPENTQLWEAYFQKNVFEMTQEENKMMQELQTYLANKTIASYEKRKEAKDKERQNRLFTKKYKQLAQNPVRNFLMLEKYLSQKFASLGAKYRYYSEVHPKNEYSQVLWIEENEKKLRRIFKKKKNK